MRYKKKMNKDQKYIIEQTLTNLENIQEVSIKKLVNDLESNSLEMKKVFTKLRLQLDEIVWFIDHLKDIEKPKPKTKKVKNK